MRLLSLEEVLYLHSRIIKRSGGKPGLRDLGLLHSAIQRPTVSFGGKDLYPTVFLKAAAPMHSLVLNHPFIDGNKRTAFAATARFLFANGHLLRVRPSEVVDLLLRVEGKRADLDNIAGWLKERCRRTKRGSAGRP